MFIKKLCPRCGQNLRITLGENVANCFFCEGYTYKQTLRHGWFTEETIGKRIEYTPAFGCSWSSRKFCLEEYDTGLPLELL